MLRPRLIFTSSSILCAGWAWLGVSHGRGLEKGASDDEGRRSRARLSSRENDRTPDFSGGSPRRAHGRLVFVSHTLGLFGGKRVRNELVAPARPPAAGGSVETLITPATAFSGERRGPTSVSQRRKWGA